MFEMCTAMRTRLRINCVERDLLERRVQESCNDDDDEEEEDASGAFLLQVLH
jgi:hypothetical protein